MNTLQADWLFDRGAQQLMNYVTQSGHEIYFVGGCVRNALIGAGVTDIDLSTSATPDEMTALAAKHGIRCIPTGIDHGTVTWVVNDTPYEITTFRKDVATDGRRATVSFSTSLKEDAERRDFTMNAIYCDANGKLIDPVGGIADLKARRVVFIGDPRKRVAEDYLRVLRFFRFHAWFGDQDAGLDPEALDACANAVEKLSSLSRERVGAEFLKLLAAPAPETALGAMDQSGVLSALVQGATTKTFFSLSALDGPKDAITRLAAICDADGLRSLRLSKKMLREATLRRELIGDPMTLSEVAYRYGLDTALSVGFLRAAVFETCAPENLHEMVAKATEATFPLAASDIMHLAEGPALGRALRAAERHWIGNDFNVSKEELIAFVERGGFDDESND